MSIIELLLIAVSLSMDAFAVSICKGLSMGKTAGVKMLVVGIYFGAFQALMPLIGYFIGAQFSAQIVAIDHWVAFILLAIIGGKMVVESLKKDPESTDDSVRWRAMLPLAIATSIDALAVGVSFAFLSVSILRAVVVIGISTFSLSVIGVKVGGLCGTRFKSKAELAGGIVLILIGTKILFSHLGLIGF